MNVPEKHRELAHAWVDGAMIQIEVNNSKWTITAFPGWNGHSNYRIDPLCEYAINKIPEHNREAYVHFHKGGEVEFLLDGRWEASTGGPSFDVHYMTYRPKPKTVKKWQWLLLVHSSALVSGDYFTDEEAMEVYGRSVLRKIPETEKEFPA